MDLTFSSAILFLSQALKRWRLAASPVQPTLHIREKRNQGSISSFRRSSFFCGRGFPPCKVKVKLTAMRTRAHDMYVICARAPASVTLLSFIKYKSFQRSSRRTETTSLTLKGLKKQSISLSRLQVRLLSSDVITSFTDVRTNVMASYETSKRAQIIQPSQRNTEDSGRVLLPAETWQTET